MHDWLARCRLVLVYDIPPVLEMPVASERLNFQPQMFLPGNARQHVRCHEHVHIYLLQVLINQKILATIEKRNT